MSSTLNTPINEENQYKVHPKKMVLWLFLVGIVMLFAGLTSAYIVKKGDPKGWVDVAMPSLFVVSTVLVVLSSATMQWAYHSAKTDEINRIKLALGLTLVLGLGFLASQLAAAQEMIDHGQYFSGNAVSVSFIYVLAGLHFAHIAGGIIYLAVLWVSSFQLKVHKKNLLKISLCTTYWHFVGGLWVYLYLFLLNA